MAGPGEVHAHLGDSLHKIHARLLVVLEDTQNSTHQKRQVPQKCEVMLRGAFVGSGMEYRESAGRRSAQQAREAVSFGWQQLSRETPLTTRFRQRERPALRRRHLRHDTSRLALKNVTHPLTPGHVFERPNSCRVETQKTAAPGRSHSMRAAESRCTLWTVCPLSYRTHYFGVRLVSR